MGEPYQICQTLALARLVFKACAVDVDYSEVPCAVSLLLVEDVAEVEVAVQDALGV